MKSLQAYYDKQSLESGALPSVSDDSRLQNVRIPQGVYPDHRATVAGNSPPPTRNAILPQSGHSSPDLGNDYQRRSSSEPSPPSGSGSQDFYMPNTHRGSVPSPYSVNGVPAPGSLYAPSGSARGNVRPFPYTPTGTTSTYQAVYGDQSQGVKSSLRTTRSTTAFNANLNELDPSRSSLPPISSMMQPSSTAASTSRPPSASPHDGANFSGYRMSRQPTSASSNSATSAFPYSSTDFQRTMSGSSTPQDYGLASGPIPRRFSDDPPSRRGSEPDLMMLQNRQMRTSEDRKQLGMLDTSLRL